MLPYAGAQLLGSVFGVVAAWAIWGRLVEQPSVLYAVIQPATSWSAAPLFLAEAAGMAFIVFTVGYFLSVPRLAPFVPWLVGILGRPFVCRASQAQGNQRGEDVLPKRTPRMSHDDTGRDLSCIRTSQLRNAVAGDGHDTAVHVMKARRCIRGRDSRFEADRNTVTVSRRPTE